MFPLSHGGGRAGDEQQDSAWTPFTIDWAVAAGLAPRWGELGTDSDYTWETREPLGPDRKDWRLCGSLSASISSSEIRRSSLGLDTPPTDDSQPHLGDSLPQGEEAAQAVDICTPLMRPAQDGSSANCSSRPWCLASSCHVWQRHLDVLSLL